MTGPTARLPLTVTFAGSGDAFGSGGRYQACIHLRAPDRAPVLLDCGATSLSALRSRGLDPGEIGVVFVSHLHGDHYYDKPIPYHLRYTDLVTHRASLTSGRIVLTHMSSDMLAHAAAARLAFETAHDGLTIQL